MEVETQYIPRIENSVSDDSYTAELKRYIIACNKNHNEIYDILIWSLGEIEDEMQALANFYNEKMHLNDILERKIRYRTVVGKLYSKRGGLDTYNVKTDKVAKKLTEEIKYNKLLQFVVFNQISQDSFVKKAVIKSIKKIEEVINEKK